MNVSKMAWKNMWFKKSLTILTILSIAVATSLIVFIQLMNQGLERGVAKGYGPYELVIGAEGSKSQLVLNSFYHVGAPVGNIEYEVYEDLTQSDLIESAYPVTRGDNYQGYAIVGTETGYLSTRYPDASLLDGKMYQTAGEAVVGYHTAKQLDLEVGDQFHGSHGAVASDVHSNLIYTIVGVLPKLGTPDDKAIFTTLDSAWIVHEEEGHEEEGNHEEEVAHGQENSEEHGLEITAIVVKPKGLMELQTLKNDFDSLEGVQATYSSKALSNVLSIIDTGSKVITLVAGVTIIIAAISILLSLTARAAERKKDIGLLRLIGKPKRYIFFSLLIEANFMAFIGAVFGVFIGHIGSYLLTDIIFQYSGIEMNAWNFVLNELNIIVGTLVLGTVSSLLPALQSYRVNPVELFHS